MKSLLKSTRNKRKSVNEKSSTSKSGPSSKVSSRSGSRLGNNRSLFDTRNRSAESDINSISDPQVPSFARNPNASQHPYSNLKQKNQRDSKSSATFMEPGRKSFESQLYDNISEFSQNAPATGTAPQDHDQTSIISNEEPIVKQTNPLTNGSNYVSPTSPTHNIDETPVGTITNTLENVNINEGQTDNIDRSSSSSASNKTANTAAKTDVASPTIKKPALVSTSQYFLPAPKLVSNSASQYLLPTPKTISAPKQQQQKAPASPSRLHRKSSLESAVPQSPIAHEISGPIPSQQLPQPHPEEQQEQPISKDVESNVSSKDDATLVSNRFPGKLNSGNYDHVVLKSGWLNKGSNMTSWSSSITADTWKLYCAELKGANLVLYKPPHDLGIKHFEPNFAKDLEGANGSSLSPVPTITEENPRSTSNDSKAQELEISSPSESENNENKSGLSNSWSTATLNKNVRQPGGFQASAEISYVSEIYPHPDLQFDESQSVANGSLEAVCHALLFNTTEDNRLSTQLISVIPLFGDTDTAIGYFIQYAIMFMCTESHTRFKQKVHGFKFPLAPTLINKKPVIISETTDLIITNRLALVVSVIQDQFPGMLMDQVIFEKLLKLLELIGVHNEALAKDLNIKVIQKQQKMTELLVFDTGSASRALTKEESTLSADNFLKLDLDEFSNQINLVDLKFNKEWNPKTDASLLYETGYSYSRYNPLIFDPVNNIHYLGRLLVNHLFEDEEAKRNVHFRAKIIQKWVELGSIFDKKGDMVSWLAIATVVCSIPILRLKKTWSAVDSKTLKTVSTEWGQVVFELDRRNMTSDTAHKSSYHVIAPQGIGESYSRYRVVPYFGDLAVKLTTNITLKQCEKRVQRVKISFNRWDEYLALVKETKDFGDLPAPNPKVQKLLYNLMSIHVSLPSLKQDDVMQLSLAIETANSSSLYQFYSACDAEKPPISAGFYYPILFTDVLPNYRLFDKVSLVDAGTAKGKNVRRSTMGEIPQNQAVTGVNSIDAMTINLHSKLKQNGPLAESVGDLLNLDTHTFHVGDDLIFKTVSKVSIEEDKPLVINVVAKASSFEKLVDILVLTPNIFSPLINKDDIQKYLTAHNIVGRNIKLDMDIGVYTETFFASYKSFCDLTTLIEGLGRRFAGAKSAAVSIKKMKENKDLSIKPFPDWDSKIDSSNPKINWKYVAQIEAGILEALYALISDFYADFTDEIQTKQCFVDILKVIDQEVVNEWKSILKQHSDGQDELFELYENLQLLYKKIRKFFIKRSYRPIDSYSTPHTFSSIIDFPPDYALIPASSSFAEIQQLIEKLDFVVFDLFRQTTVSEWMAVADLFEMQTVRSTTGIFSYKQPSPAISEEDLKILNVFLWLESLFVESPDVKLLSKFPSNIRALYGLHGKITSYILNQIIEPRLPIAKRRNRMTSILQMLAIIRCRMKPTNMFTAPNGTQTGRIPAFLESCIAMAVCAPESRWFVNDWIYASVKLHIKENVLKWDTLEDLVPDLSSNILLKDYKSPLTPCFGWLAERLLEVGCYIPNVSVENPLLLNFDKRRYVYKLITSLMSLKKEESVFSKEEISEIKKRFEFLYNIKRSVYDLRDIREAARRENKDYSRTEQKNKLFQHLVEVEFEKLKRDVRKKDSVEQLEKSRKRNGPYISKPRNFTTITEGFDRQNTAEIKQLNVTSNGSSQNTLAPNSNSSYNNAAKSGGRFRIGGFLKSVRPFSINVASSWSAPDRVASVDELPDTRALSDKSKPAYVLKVINSKPLLIHSSDIEGFFKFIDMDGQEHCFQAPNNAEAGDWVKSINEAKRYSYLSNDAKERNGTKVFGVPIQLVCEREGKVVPYVVEKLLDEIESRGLDEVGLYRVPGAVANIQSLKQKFDESSEVSLDDQRWLEINTLAGCFKLYLRELPESLLTVELLPSFIAVTKSENVADKVSSLVKQLPFHNYHLLKRLVSHLNQVTEHSAKNRMDASNLAMVFSMSFLSASDNDFGRSLGSLQSILHMMIQDPVPFFKNTEYEKAAVSFIE